MRLCGVVLAAAFCLDLNGLGLLVQIWRFFWICSVMGAMRSKDCVIEGDGGLESECDEGMFLNVTKSS